MTMSLITLNEAVTYILGKGQRTPAQEVVPLYTDQQELSFGRDAFVENFRLAGKDISLVKPIAFWPPDRTLEQLSVLPVGPSKDLDKLLRLVLKIYQKWHKYDLQYEAAFVSLRDAIRVGEVIAYGRESRSFGARVHRIPKVYCAGQVTIDGDREHLTVGSNTAMRVQIINRPDCAETHYSVNVDFDSLRKTFPRPPKIKTQRRMPTPSNADFAEWFVDFLCPFMKQKNRPTEAQVEAGICLNWPELTNSRENARQLLRKHWPGRPGRPKKSA